MVRVPGLTLELIQRIDLGHGVSHLLRPWMAGADRACTACPCAAACAASVASFWRRLARRRRTVLVDVRGGVKVLLGCRLRLAGTWNVALDGEERR
jgi:hypothetical protein